MSNPLDDSVQDFAADGQPAFDTAALGNLFSSLSESGIDPMSMLQGMMAGLGEGEEGEAFLDLMNNFMSAINPEEIARESTEKIIELYTNYLDSNRDILPAEDYQKYDSQLQLHKEVLVLIDRHAEEAEFQELAARMNFPPEDIPEEIRAALQPDPSEQEMGGCPMQ